jgi:hypothetical protein
MVRQDPTWTGKDSLTYIGARGDFTGYFDVAVLDPTGGISDVLRFYNPPLNTNPLEPNYTWIIFYSGTGSAPADRNGIPPEISTGFTFGDGHLHVLYTVNENSDGTFLWESTTGNNFYGWSEGHAPNPTVPLPAAIWLLGPGLVGLAAIRRRLMK